MIVRQSVYAFVGSYRQKIRRGKTETYKLRGTGEKFLQVAETDDGFSALDVLPSREDDPASEVAAREVMDITLARVWPCYVNRFATVSAVVNALAAGAQFGEMELSGLPFRRADLPWSRGRYSASEGKKLAGVQGGQ
jgi:hypothetical protein